MGVESNPRLDIFLPHLQFSLILLENASIDAKQTMIQIPPQNVSITYVLNFPQFEKSVRYQQGLAESAFGEIVNAQSQQTNLPDDFDANQPRILFPSERKTIAISQVSCQLTQNFSKSGKGFEEELAIARKNAIEFAKRAYLFKPAYEAHSLVLELRYPNVGSINEIANLIYKQFVRIEPVGEVASTIFQFGFKFEGLYLNIGANPYEQRQLPTAGPDGFSVVRADEMNVLETGLQLKIDVNNLPDFRQGNEGAPDRLFDAISKFLSDSFSNVFGFPLR